MSSDQWSLDPLEYGHVSSLGHVSASQHVQCSLDRNPSYYFYYKRRYSLDTTLPLSFSSLYFWYLHRQTPKTNSVTQKMSTLIVPATIPSVSEDCEQLRKAFEGLPLLTLSTSFARVCVYFLTIQTLFFMIQIFWESKFTFFAPSFDF